MLYYPVARSGRFDIDPIPLQSVVVGDVVSLDLASFLTSDAPAVVWSVVGGALPPGLTLSAGGVVSGTVAGTGGAFVAQVEADAGALGVAAQAVAFSVPSTIGSSDSILATGGTQVDFTLAGKNLRSATFLGAGVFEVTRAGYLEDGWVIGGAGGGAKHTSTNVAAGGGSCGQVRRLRNPDGSRIWLDVGFYTIEVGAGGPASTSATKGGNGSQSSAFGIVALGGGGGGTATAEPGPGGGGGSTNGATAMAGGGPFGNAPGTRENGHRGGTGRISTSAPRAGGGAGAGQPGYDGLMTTTTTPLASDYSNGNGGDGIQIYCRTGVAEWIGGGGGGGVGTGIGNRPGGQGGGGNGGGVSGANATSGAANTGSGGGGASTGNAGNGGSGIVIICWER